VCLWNWCPWCWGMHGMAWMQCHAFLVSDAAEAWHTCNDSDAGSTAYNTWCMPPYIHTQKP
jgi:hypothetical protein